MPRVNIPPIIIPPDKPAPPRVKKRNHQQEAPAAPPLMPKIETRNAPSTHQYPFRHPRHKLPAVSSAQYANAANYIKHLEANAVLNPVTGVLQEFCHLIKRPDKEMWTKYLANEFGRLAQGVSKRIEGTNTIYFIPKEEVPFKNQESHISQNCLRHPPQQSRYPSHPHHSRRKPARLCRNTHRTNSNHHNS